MTRKARMDSSNVDREPGHNLEASAQLETAVLFLVFNRPESTARVFQAIRKAKPAQLYVAADGPRSNRSDEARHCAEVRRIATAVDWPCEVRTLFRETNLGCRRAVSRAIEWFFEHVEEGIILEDDCVPDPSFFQFTQELLALYRDDNRVMVISGDHFHGAAHQPPYSYFFSRYNHCWGWASWRRAWKSYDRDMSLWPALRNSEWLLGVGDGCRLFQRYWTEMFDRAYEGEVDSWAYRWTFSCWAQNGLTILPARNLVTNIGFGVDATHTKSTSGAESSLKLETMDFPLVHPIGMVRDVAADLWTDRHVLGISRWTSLKNSVRKIPGVHVLARILRAN